MRKFSLIIIFFTLICVQAYGAPRYISLAPSTTEILFALGLHEEIIGVSSYCNYPKEALKKEKFGTFSEPNIEKIIFARPDIVFATGLEQSQAVLRLEKSGIRVFVSDPKNIEEFLQSISQLGELTGKKQAADSLISGLRQRLEVIKIKVSAIPKEARRKVFIEIWHDPVMTAGPGSIIDEAISMAGGVNIAFDAPRAYSRFSSEVIVQRNPDVVILGYMSSDNTTDMVSRRLGWQKIKAVRDGRIIRNIDPDLILRPGPRLVDGIEAIYQCLYEK